MTQKGKKNSNYRHGKYVNPTCECGNKKDPRSIVCAICSKKSHPVGGFNRDEQIKQAVKNSNSFVEVARKTTCSRGYVAKFVKIHNIDISHMRPGRNRERSNDDLFVIGKKRTNGTIRTRILRDNLIEYKCSECGSNPEWKYKPLTLQLEHKNGNAMDNRLENLTFLCPNCHSQTNTYVGKNSTKVTKEKEVSDG